MATILIVDDERPVRNYLTRLLTSRGHEVLQAGDGAEGLEAVRTSHPDLVIADILMPTMDGYEFVRQLRADPAIAATPVIFHSASYHHQEAHALARACGVLHVISKPAGPQEILDVVAAALAGQPAPVP